MSGAAFYTWTSLGQALSLSASAHKALILDLEGQGRCQSLSVLDECRSWLMAATCMAVSCSEIYEYRRNTYIM